MILIERRPVLFRDRWPVTASDTPPPAKLKPASSAEKVIISLNISRLTPQFIVGSAMDVRQSSLLYPELGARLKKLDARSAKLDAGFPEVDAWISEPDAKNRELEAKADSLDSAGCQLASKPR